MRESKKKEIKILVVDDHEMQREGLKLALLDYKHIKVVGEAGSGREAIMKSQQLKPDVIILDLGLPDMLGVKATSSILSIDPAIKILALTHHKDPEIIYNVVEAGATGYVIKDTNVPQLIQAIEAVYSHELFFDPQIEGLAEMYLKNIKLTLETTANTKLTQRQLEVLVGITQGSNNKAIAAKLKISVRTVESHKRNIMQKLKIKGTADLTRYALKKGLI